MVSRLGMLDEEKSGVVSRYKALEESTICL